MCSTRSRKVVTYTDHRDFPFSSWSDVSDWPVLETIANQGILIIGDFNNNNNNNTNLNDVQGIVRMLLVVMNIKSSFSIKKPEDLT